MFQITVVDRTIVYSFSNGPQDINYIKTTLHKYLLIFITMSCTRLVNADSSKMKIILPKIAKKLLS